MPKKDSDFVVIEERIRSVAFDISHEKITQTVEFLAERFKAINALYEEMERAEEKWQAAFGELDAFVKGLKSDEERWAFMTALTQLNARKMSVRAAEDACIFGLYDYCYGEKLISESVQVSWDCALDLNPKALEEILGESKAVQKWLAKLDEPSVVRVVKDGKRTAVLQWRPGDEAVVVEPDYVGAAQASAKKRKG